MVSRFLFRVRLFGFPNRPPRRPRWQLRAPVAAPLRLLTEGDLLILTVNRIFTVHVPRLPFSVSNLRSSPSRLTVTADPQRWVIRRARQARTHRSTSGTFRSCEKTVTVKIGVNCDGSDGNRTKTLISLSKFPSYS